MAHNNQRLALFFTPAQISWLSVGLGSPDEIAGLLAEIELDCRGVDYQRLH